MVMKQSAVNVVLGVFLSLAYIGGVQAAVSYAPPVSTSVATASAPGADNPEFIAKGDLDGLGGINDLVTVNEKDRTVTVLLRDGAGVLTSNASYAVGNDSRQVAIGDLDGINGDDLVVPSTGSGNVTVLLNNGSGGFTEESTESPILLGGIPTSPVIADLDGGVGLDIAITNASTNEVHILSGDGDGTFTPGASIAVGAKPLFMAAGDTNNDTNIDLVVTNYDADTVSVLLGNGSGVFANASGSPFTTDGTKPWSVHIGSIDTLNDAFPDLVLVNYINGRSVAVYNGAGDGTFTLQFRSPINTIEPKPHSVEITELNGDAFADLVVSNDNDLTDLTPPATSGTTGVTVLLGDGAGDFPTITHYPISGQPNGVVSLDLDGVNQLDLAVANGSTGNVDVLLNVTASTDPVASDDALAVTEDTATTGTLSATDADGALLSYSIVTNGTKGTAVITDAATGAYTYTPNANESGGDTFTFKANDGTADSNTATITVTIAAVNDAPTISGTPATKVGLNTAYRFTPGGDDVDVGDTLTYSITNKPTWASFSTTTGALTGTPAYANVGTTTGIVIAVSDGIADPVSLAAFNLRVVGVVNVTASDATATEAGRTTGRFTFTRTGSTAAALTVNYIVGGTATAGRDYVSLGGRITFPIGARTVTRIVKPIDDTLQELKETVILSLSQSPNYTVGSARRASVILTSNETVTRVITVAASDATATEAGRTTGRFTFTRTGSTAAALTVNYIVGGTATAGSDYVSLGNRITFPIGARTVTRIVKPINDTLQELNERVILTLSQSPNYAVGSARRATVTVTSND